jgi:hypothetical protein
MTLPRWKTRLRQPVALALLLLGVPAATPLLAGNPTEPIPCATSQALAEIDRVESAMLLWLTDVVSRLGAPARQGGPPCAGSVPADLSLVPSISIADLRALLVPFYIAEVPERDPWGTPYDYRLNVANPLSMEALAARTAGSDGLFAGPIYAVGTTNGPEEDLVRYNGYRVRQPPRLDPVSRQQETSAAMLNLGTAWISWYTDVVSAATRPRSFGATVDLSLLTPIPAADVAAFLTPFYTLCVPELDGWGNTLDLRLNDDLLDSPVMSIRSSGRDGLLEGDVYDTEIFPADDLDRDLVWSDGLYFQSPTATRSGIFTDDFESGALWGTWSCGPSF